MKKISVMITGCAVSREEAQEIGRVLAAKDNPDTDVVARYNRLTNSCSPCCLKEKFGDRPGWEVYGENHGGRLKININAGDYIFIFS
ncbi:MAG: AF1514 family protein [Desulfurivibrionaceae bacterium]